MTLQDILNSNLSDTHKIEIITMLQKGGLAPDQKTERESINEKEDTPYLDKDRQQVPTERQKSSAELKSPRSKKTITPTETIIIGDKEYEVAIADTPEQRKKGLEPYTYLRPDEGMLFIFDDEVDEYFTMKNCGIDLDIVFIDNEGAVIQVESVEAYDPDPVVCDEPYQFVLEVGINSGIDEGDELRQEDDELNDDDKEFVQSKNKMLVLDSNGDVQMKLSGGERIFSRICTRKMIKAAIQAYREDTDLAYRKVGKLVLKELDAQDNRDSEYVQLDE